MRRRKLAIDRKVWLRGEGSDSSALYRSSDKKQCCVGIYLNALGVPKRVMDNIGAADCIDKIPKSASWLLSETYANSAQAENLYIQNDNPNLNPKTRERLIKDTFAANGVDVEFVG